MSDFGRSGGGTASSGDWYRYAWLFVLATLVLLVVFGFQEGVVLIVLAIYLLAGAATLLVVTLRRRRS